MIENDSTSKEDNSDLVEKKVIFKSSTVNLSQTKDGKTYFKNGEKLEKEEPNDSYDIDEFNQLISIETNKFINQNFKNIIVLFGAGASVTNNEIEEDEQGIAKTGVTVPVIAKKVSDALKENKYNMRKKSGNNLTPSENGQDMVTLEVFTLNEIAEKSKYTKGITETNEIDTSKFNLEDFLSNLFAFEKFISTDDSEYEKFNNTKNAILDIIIRATSYDYDKHTFKHVKLLNILSKLTTPKNKLNLVTTNYDTLIEDAAESMKWTVFDGFSFSQTPQFDSTMFDWNLVKDVPNVKTNEHIFKKNVVNLLKIHGSLTWELSTNKDNILRKTKNSVKKPIMVFPSSDKYAQSYQEPFFDLFSKFQNLLQKPNTLLITVGFSFADNHIARIILNAIQTNDSLATLITDFNIQSEIDNWKELENAMDNFYNIAFVGSSLHDKLTDYLGGYSYDD